MKLLWERGIQEVTRWMMVSHLLHRIWATVVTGMIIWTAVRVARLPASLSHLRKFSWGLIALVVVQITLGILTILTERQFTITSLHVVTGAMTLAVSVQLAMSVRNLVAARGTVSSQSRVSAVAEEVTA